MPEAMKSQRPSSGDGMVSRLSLAAKLYSIFALFAVLTAVITVLSDYNTRRNAELTEAIETAAAISGVIPRDSLLRTSGVAASDNSQSRKEPTVSEDTAAKAAASWVSMIRRVTSSSS